MNRNRFRKAFGLLIVLALAVDSPAASPFVLRVDGRRYAVKTGANVFPASQETGHD